MTTIKRPVLRYHGGKFLLAPWIISHFPAHKIYTEVFGGAASVLMRKSRSFAEIYNDKWDTVVNVFRILRDPLQAAELERLIRLTPYSRTEFMQCGEVEMAELSDPLEKARRTILRSFAGFGSASANAAHATGFRNKARNTFTTPAEDWRNYPDCISWFTNRLQGVIIENRDYKDVLQKHDGPDTLHFVDPPYLHSTRNIRRGNWNYAHEFAEQDHIELFQVLESLIGAVIVCGYASELYQELYGSWHIFRKSTHADGATPRIECLWINENAMKRSSQKLL